MAEMHGDERSRLTAQALESEQIIKDLKAELEELTGLFHQTHNQQMKERLATENESLRKQVAEHKELLKKYEVEHKVPQIARPPFPRDIGANVIHITTPSEIAGKQVVEAVPPNQSKKPKAHSKKTAGSGENISGSKSETAVDIRRLDLRIGKIISAKKHPDADTLYVEEVDVGEEQPRTVVSGLVGFVPLEEMQGRMAVLLCNLKPVKMRGVTSQAMVMCAITPEKVEILDPPTDSLPGDQVHVEGYPREPDAILNPKHKVFETVAPDLKTDSNRVAGYKGVPWTVPGKGSITARTLTGVPIK